MGIFRTAQGRAGPVISIVNPETRHGHKTSAREFGGYKGHITLDPDSKVITATGSHPETAVTPKRDHGARRCR